MIRTLLIANRGEIAVRVIRAAREMGIRTVAVASEADRDAIHARLADACVVLGPPEPALSYLDIERVIGACRETGADAVHPGYGFLSERAEFAAACAAAGIVFVGPPPEAMRALGGKIDAKRLATEAGVPIAPGFFEPGASAGRLQEAADAIGYPVMLKASAGGGGRGMRIVRDRTDFLAELATATDEALQAFGDGEMMVEKLVERPRHVEVQILADRHGNVACLFERECSLQRRHQKLVEEAPSPLIQDRLPHLWPLMRDATRALAVRAGYVGAGTAEYLVDEASGAFYFLEVNARLQVEHPVTEAITGLDLVRWQLRIAAGEALDLPPALTEGDRSAIRGHAIEARIVAEDPAANFLPSVGKLLAWTEPSGPGIRVDTGFGPGGEVSRYYDSLLAKTIAHGETRVAACDRLRDALLDFHILGVKTNLGYLIDVLSHSAFASGDFDTGFLGREFKDWQPNLPESGLLELLTAVEVGAGVAVDGASARRTGAWDTSDGWRAFRVEEP